MRSGAIGVAGQLQLAVARPAEAAELLFVAVDHPATFDYMRDDFQLALDEAMAALSAAEQENVRRRAAATTPDAAAESILRR